jgi:4-amino-4-deoxychorismate lyase
MLSHNSGIAKSSSFSSDDRIFLGEGLIETIRVDQQRPCYPYLHWQRMSQAAMLLGIPFDLTSDVWYDQLIYCIHEAKINGGGIKVILSGGRAPRGLAARGEAPTLLFEAFNYPHHRQALCLVSASWLRDAKNPIYQLKSVNYLESILARRQALACGADDALFFNLDYYATETTIANLFIVKDDQLFTPMLASGVLAGITRGRLLRLAASQGIKSSEVLIDSAKIVEADAVFVTNALQGIRFVKSFDGHRLPVHHSLVSLLQQVLAKDKERYDIHAPNPSLWH